MHSANHTGLPQGPGLGVTFDPAACERHPWRNVLFNLFAGNWHFRRAELPPTGP